MKTVKKIEIILSHLDIKAPTFAKKIGTTYQQIWDIQRKKTQKISGELAKKINATYPQFSIEWLLSDTNEMPAFISNSGKQNINTGINNGSQIISDQSHEIELLKKHIATLEQTVADKNEIIELLRRKNKSKK